MMFGTKFSAWATTTLLAAVCTVGSWSSASAHKYKFHVLYSFCTETDCADGSSPHAALLIDPHGNLFGTTQSGAIGNNGESGGSGTVFELVPNGRKWKFKTLYSFCPEKKCADGSNSQAKLIMDTSGNLYGTTYHGGSGDNGVAYELSPNATGKRWRHKLLYDFCATANCQDGAGPNGGLTYFGAASGAPYDGTSPLYGNTEDGGDQDNGVVFQIQPQSPHWGETVLHRFCSDANCADGRQPVGTPVVDGDGRLFGTTVHGGNSSDAGVVYAIAGANETVEYAFCPESGCLDGEEPNWPVLLDEHGHIFGTTVFGGTTISGGTLFTIVGNQEQVLHNFCSEANCTDGAQPSSDVIEDSAGHLFGTTGQGGAHNEGVVYEYNRGTFQVLHDFCSGAGCGDGAGPIGGLIMDASGNLFGTTIIGGAFGKGTVFELEY